MWGHRSGSSQPQDHPQPTEGRDRSRQNWFSETVPGTLVVCVWSPIQCMRCEVDSVWCVCVPQTLQEMSSLHKASYTEAQAEYNEDKNRFPDNLPSEYA